jgi:hypothetical protein
MRYLGLPHQQLPYCISLLNVLLKLTIIIHRHFHLLSSIVHCCMSRDLSLHEPVAMVELTTMLYTLSFGAPFEDKP